ncbi:uncharacterized protein LOC119669000 [Teleopsis dalmanni]|uniref:uncharacterized protein LOC119666960 n=1 Tax=Teleopsis dalmanni TaxID=139649 RepID=UPI000D32B719|nr:uncharacterized protein LOC119666960 [Teleopsis dalmanni]XP_037934537.1 uncharacterized protein LOC119668926 [Teleopsis dalmanni]XP_037934654.1 uncharacterized protein LOC119669000 [Teleopsis dalmanni]
MASSNVDSWDLPLPTSTSSTSVEEEEIPDDERRRNENMEKLKKYVDRMAYQPQPPYIAKPTFERLKEPKKHAVLYTAEYYADIMTPRLRGERMKNLAWKHNAITTEQLEDIIKNHKAKERRREDLLKRKQELYYEMLTKMERQCRTQYLNVLIQKFAKFIANLATTIKVPPQLVEPFNRMQRGIFCNILLAIGVHPNNQAAVYYTTKEAVEYEVCHKLAHALLSLIVKALDTAAAKNPEDIQPIQDIDFEMDNYIKDRLMCAAEKKIMHSRKERKARAIKVYKNPCKEPRLFID